MAPTKRALIVGCNYPGVILYCYCMECSAAHPRSQVSQTITRVGSVPASEPLLDVLRGRYNPLQ
jgi:hypothetical protein